MENSSGRYSASAAALFHRMTMDAVSDLDLPRTPPLAAPEEAIQMSARAWQRELRLHQGRVGIRLLVVHIGQQADVCAAAAAARWGRTRTCLR